MNRTTEQWIEALNLRPHPEGGFFVESYRSTESLSSTALPDRYGSDRTFSTAIYFLLKLDQFSAFHRVASDELWHAYDGLPVRLYLLAEEGKLTEFDLGLDLTAGQQPQIAIPANHWFAAKPIDTTASPYDYSLVGCTVSPGFDFADFELASRPDLLKQFPAHASIISMLTLNPPAEYLLSPDNSVII